MASALQTNRLPQNDRSRVGGSGFTVLAWDSTIIGFAQQVQDQSPQPVGPGATAIHPIDEPYAIEIVTPGAIGVGTLVLRLYERYTLKAWETLGQDLKTGSQSSNSLSGTTDLVDIFLILAESTKPLTITKIIRPPYINLSQQAGAYFEQYHGCAVTNVSDSEQVEIGTMEILKDITVQYLYRTNSLKGTSGNSGKGFAFRDAAIPSASGVNGGSLPLQNFT